MKYYIPLYGWLVAIREWRQSVKEYSAALDAGFDGQRAFIKTNQTYSNTVTGFKVTIGVITIVQLLLVFSFFLRVC